MTVPEVPVSGLPPDVVPVAVPTPFPMIPTVSTYLLLGERPTLIDVGPRTAAASEWIGRALAQAGLLVTDLDLILLTHHHCDHAGLAGDLGGQSGASVAAIRPVADHLGSIRESLEADDAFARALLRRHGFTDGMIEAISAEETSKRPFHGGAVVDRVIEPGERILVGNRELTVHHRPGHSPMDTVFHDEGGRLLFGGDHLFEATASCPYLHCPPRSSGPEADAMRPLVSPLPGYLESLARTARLEIDLVLPGHGEAFSGHRQVIAARSAKVRSRGVQLARSLESPRTVAALIDERWPRLPVSKRYLVFSELLGLLELEVLVGRVELIRGGTGRPDEFVKTGAA